MKVMILFFLEPRQNKSTEQDETARHLSLWQFILKSTFYVRSVAAARTFDSSRVLNVFGGFNKARESLLIIFMDVLI